jgi:hypothetical protein
MIDQSYRADQQFGPLQSAIAAVPTNSCPAVIPATSNASAIMKIDKILFIGDSIHQQPPPLHSAIAVPGEKTK